jgi:hypothetical protein
MGKVASTFVKPFTTLDEFEDRVLSVILLVR